MIEGVKVETAKKVTTYDFERKENGFLVELFKDGEKTVVYKTTLKPGAFKGYHLHRIRAARYVCIKGKVKIILYKNKERQEVLMDAKNPERLFIPPNVATGLKNEGNEDAWIINYPNPPYDPNLKGEQIEYTEEELSKELLNRLHQ